MQDHKLQTALKEYEKEKWRFVATKLGPGFTPTACQERFVELFGEGAVVEADTKTTRHEGSPDLVGGEDDEDDDKDQGRGG